MTPADFIFPLSLPDALALPLLNAEEVDELEDVLALQDSVGDGADSVSMSSIGYACGGKRTGPRVGPRVKTGASLMILGFGRAWCSGNGRVCWLFADGNGDRSAGVAAGDGVGVDELE